MHKARLRVFVIFMLALKSSYVFAQSPDTLVVHFNFNKYNISSADSPVLREFIGLHSNKQVKDLLEIYGYCDSTGSVPYNVNLSLVRIFAVTR